MRQLLTDVQAWLWCLGPGVWLLGMVWALVLWVLLLLAVRHHLAGVELALLRELSRYDWYALAQLQRNFAAPRWFPLRVYLRRLQRFGWVEVHATSATSPYWRTWYRLTADGVGALAREESRYESE